MIEYYDDEAPESWPTRLRAIAGWLDITSPLVAAVMKTHPEDPGLPEALELVEGADMQKDLRFLADVLEEVTEIVVEEEKNTKRVETAPTLK